MWGCGLYKERANTTVIILAVTGDNRSPFLNDIDNYEYYRQGRFCVDQILRMLSVFMMLHRYKEYGIFFILSVVIRINLMPWHKNAFYITDPSPSTGGSLSQRIGTLELWWFLYCWNKLLKNRVCGYLRRRSSVTNNQCRLFQISIVLSRQRNRLFSLFNSDNKISFLVNDMDSYQY